MGRRFTLRICSYHSNTLTINARIAVSHREKVQAADRSRTDKYVDQTEELKK
jgi:hypothetical protein